LLVLPACLRRGAASGRLRPMPDATVAARLVAELVAWFAWHRRNSHDAGLYDDQLARRTVIEFVCAALVPLGPTPKSTPKEDESWTEHD
jgi:hypothetical protein